MNFSQIYLSGEGRLNRKGFWISAIGLAIMLLFLLFLIGVLLIPFGGSDTKFGAKLLGLISAAIGLYPSYNIVLKRLHDRGRPENLVWVFLVPGIASTLFQVLEISGRYQKTVFLGQESLAFAPNGLGMLISLITFGIGIWALIELGILPGEKSRNAHGPDPSAPYQ